MSTHCHRCGRDAEDNDGPMTDCPECDRSLCDWCYGDRSFEWCKACRKADLAKIEARANAGGEAHGNR